MYCYLSRALSTINALVSLPFFGKRLGLLTNYLIKTLIDRAYKINNTTQGFQNDIKNLSVILKRNLFPNWLIDKSVKGYLRKVKTTEQDTSRSDISNCHFYKLPYIGFYPSYTGKKISSIINKYCKDLNVKVIFPPFKLSSMFSPKDFIPESLKSRVVYQFTCASCGARYIGETNRHFHTRVNEHFFRPKIYPKTVANTYPASLGLFSWIECPFGSRVIKCDFVDM